MIEKVFEICPSCKEQMKWQWNKFWGQMDNYCYNTKIHEPIDIWICGEKINFRYGRQEIMTGPIEEKRKIYTVAKIECISMIINKLYDLCPICGEKMLFKHHEDTRQKWAQNDCWAALGKKHPPLEIDILEDHIYIIYSNLYFSSTEKLERFLKLEAFS